MGFMYSSYGRQSGDLPCNGSLSQPNSMTLWPSSVSALCSKPLSWISSGSVGSWTRSSSTAGAGPGAGAGAHASGASDSIGSSSHNSRANFSRSSSYFTPNDSLPPPAQSGMAIFGSGSSMHKSPRPICRISSSCSSRVWICTCSGAVKTTGSPSPSSSGAAAGAAPGSPSGAPGRLGAGGRARSMAARCSSVRSGWSRAFSRSSMGLYHL
mmetsp:Transcript_15498/g.45822  ORF Transcript_15498/g.45822 Transcript_15498/m.45822 type:complete len:211 (+) Transcript_15498:175-807(+)